MGSERGAMERIEERLNRLRLPGMTHPSKSGHLAYSVPGGVFGWAVPLTYREIVPWIMFDVEGLPERWLKIVMGQTNWIPKIVFKMDAKKEDKKIRLLLRH